MSTGQRIGLIALAVAVVAVAFVVARSEDDAEHRPTTSSPDRTTTGPARSSTTDATAATTRREHRIRLVGHRPAGGVRRIEAKKGELVRITVESDAPDEVHLHGYDIETPTAPGAPARFSFRAEIEGDFEIEGHARGQAVIARLRVEPA